MCGGKVMGSKFSDRRKIVGRVSVAEKASCVEMICLCGSGKGWEVLLDP